MGEEISPVKELRRVQPHKRKVYQVSHIISEFCCFEEMYHLLNLEQVKTKQGTQCIAYYSDQAGC